VHADRSTAAGIVQTEKAVRLFGSMLISVVASFMMMLLRRHEILNANVNVRKSTNIFRIEAEEAALFPKNELSRAPRRPALPLSFRLLSGRRRSTQSCR
jgi:hypothetical protein